MFLVYIDGFMSSNPSWHQPNPRYQQQQQQQQQQQGVPPHVYGTNNNNNNNNKDTVTPMAPPPHFYGTNTNNNNNNNMGCRPFSFLWYQQQKQGAPPPVPLVMGCFSSFYGTNPRY